jgi:hypothetical protein
MARPWFIYFAPSLKLPANHKMVNSKCIGDNISIPFQQNGTTQGPHEKLIRGSLQQHSISLNNVTGKLRTMSKASSFIEEGMEMGTFFFRRTLSATHSTAISTQKAPM